MEYLNIRSQFLFLFDISHINEEIEKVITCKTVLLLLTLTEFTHVWKQYLHDKNADVDIPVHKLKKLNRPDQSKTGRVIHLKLSMNFKESSKFNAFASPVARYIIVYG